MFIDNTIWIGDSDGERISMPLKMANRHGLIAGATGTGKTTTLKVLAESFADAGVPVFLSDAKGDLSGMCEKGVDTDAARERIQQFNLSEYGFDYSAYATAFWDIFGQNGIPLRTTISEMGPILLSKLMDLNDTQSDILTCLFKMADDENLLLVDIKDLKAILQYASDNAEELSREYGNITKQSVAAIIRNVVALEAAGGDAYFTEPALNIVDFFTKNLDGRGTINILDATKLATDPTLYSAFLLYLLSELFETLPEVGDLDKPRMVFFFDEAHLLFKDISKALQAKIEQIVKLIRSKGVGLYFITQSPTDIPNGVLSQLSNKVQHALRAYTPSEERALKTAADSFRSNPDFDTKEVLANLGVGEALVSVLDEEGVPTIVKQCKILPPKSLMGPTSQDNRQKMILTNDLYLKYKDSYDPDSAYEFLQRQSEQRAMAEETAKKAEEERRRAEKEEAMRQKQLEREEAAKAKQAEKEEAMRQKLLAQEEAARIKKAEKEEAARIRAEEKAAQKAAAAKKRVVKSVASSAAGTIGRELGQNLGKSVGGTFGKRIGGNVASQLGRSLMGTLFK